jgi:hypothetical protein
MSTAAHHDYDHAGDEMLDIEEAAALLRKSVGTMRYWRHLGVGPRSFKVGRHVRYWRTDLILWLTEQSRRPDSDAAQRDR